MSVSKFFIKRLNGIKLNVTSSLVVVCLTAFSLLLWGKAPQAAAAESYNFEFKNQTESLTGQTVNYDLTFQKMGYWQVKKATLNLNFQLSQLSDRQESDLTVAVNGVKVASFRPEKTTQRQTKTVEIPVDLLESTNVLRISGQIVDRVAGKYQTQQTPANWLTIYQGANINFQYTEKKPEPSLRSFFQYFTGLDHVTKNEAAVLVNQGADDGELTAALTALMGQSQMSSSDSGQLNLKSYQANTNYRYSVVVAKYAHLPAELRAKISADKVDGHGWIQTVDLGQGRYQLVLTAKTDRLLKKTAEFFANQELMQERKQSFKQIDLRTKTFPKSQRVGRLNQQLTTQSVTLTGRGRQEQLFSVGLPTGQTQALGSQMKVHFNYSPALDFSKSQVKVYVNGQMMAEKKLTAKAAHADSLTVKLPQRKEPQSSYQIKVAFDLQGKKHQKNAELWTQITPDSLAQINSQPLNSLLFDNFPGAWIKHRDLSQVVVVRPRKLTADDLDSLSNIFVLMGVNVNSSHGLEVTTSPSQKALQTKNVIAVGTPQQNQLIKQNNQHLYVKFAPDLSKFVSNEKLSVEDDWGKHLGTVQLLRSPYNGKRAFLVATAPNPHAIYLATLQLASAKKMEQYQNKDVFVIDEDNVSNSYRFKKDAVLDHQLAQAIRSREQRQMYLYLVAAGIAVLLLVGVTWWLVVRKNRSAKGNRK